MHEVPYIHRTTTYICKKLDIKMYAPTGEQEPFADQVDSWDN